ncbi:MAG: NAD-dependent deacetylase [Chloroflexota bacterium]|nr:NAD-dependent deacetylase [Chloroflexota bacterium]
MTIERAAELLQAARSGVAFTGAGASAESGIPTFRGAGGLWTKYDPIKVSSIDSFMQDPTAYWMVSKERGGIALAARPNPGHLALVSLEAAGHLVAIVTQNTDGLHQASGSRRVVEVHGSSRNVQCLDCGLRESRAVVQARLAVQMPPQCKACGGTHLKPTVVLFGEPMPVAAMQEALALAQSADVMLVVGSSLVVRPAADIPLAAVRSGARLIIINAERTPFDSLAEVVIHGRAGEVLPQILSLVGV